jgi:monothiol glutaredoxin
MSRDVQQEIKTLVESNAVVLFMKGTRRMPQCGFSATAIGILDDLGVEFKDVNVLSDPDIRDGVKRFSDWPTVPQLYVGGEFIGGSDIMQEMHQNNTLADIVKQVAKV